MIQSVSNSLDAMSVPQYLMAFLFLASYTMALSQFSEGRGRGYAAACAFVSALCFMLLTDTWQQGALVVGFGVVTVGGLAAGVWGLWTFLCWQHARGGTQASRSPDDALTTVAATL